MIRKGLYSDIDITNKDDVIGIEHLDYYIDILRQSIIVIYGKPSLYRKLPY